MPRRERLVYWVGATVLSGVFVALAARFEVMKVVWVIGAALVAGLVLLRLRLGVLLVAFAIPFPFYSTKLSAFIGTNEILILAIVGLWIGAGLVQRRLPALGPFALPAFVFLAAGALAAVGAEDSATALWTLVRWTLAFAWMIVVQDWVETTMDLRRFETVLLAAMAVVALLGIFQYVGGPIVVPQYSRGRIDSTFGYVNVLGSYLLVSLAFLGSGLFQQPLRKGVAGVFRIAAVTLGAVALLLTFSRGALFGLFLGLIVAATVSRRLRGPLILGGVGMGTILAALMLVNSAVRMYLVGRFANLLRPAGGESLRGIVWSAALYALPRTTPFGLGFGNFRALLRQQPQAAFLPAILYHPHNVWLAVYFETGIAGLLGFGWLVWRALNRSYRLSREPTTMTGVLGLGGLWALTGLLTQLLVDYTIYEFAMILSLTTLLGLIGAAEKLRAAPAAV